MEETKQQGQAVTYSLQSFKNAIRNLDISGIFFILFYFINFDQKTNKQTNKQTEITLAGTPQQLWPITVGLDTNWIKKNKNKKY